MTHPLNALKRFAFYEALADWLVRAITNAPRSSRPLLIGLNAPQGAGKSTLATYLVESLAAKSRVACAVSIDDFYLTRGEQVKLAEASPRNPYLQQRGYPGTHDISLGTRTLKHLKNASVNEVVLCPRYDKSLHGGQGDRSPEAEWSKIQAPLDLVLVEGWMLGFTPVADEDALEPALREINRLLARYAEWTSLLDGLIILRPEKSEFVVDWRIEAEEKMKASGKPGMSRAEIETYIRKFLPAYELYSPGLVQEPPVKGNLLAMTIDKTRLPSDIAAAKVDFFHLIADPASAEVRRYLVENDLTTFIEFRNVAYDSHSDALKAAGGSGLVPSLLVDGKLLVEGKDAVLKWLDSKLRSNLA